MDIGGVEVANVATLNNITLSPPAQLTKLEIDFIK